jgi:uroporphyrinogen-III synthase
LYVVGERTREAAERVHWIAPIRIGADARELIDLLRQDSPRLRRLLYLAGRDRKPDIETAAKYIGFDLDVVETYVAREAASLTPEAEAALRTGEVDAVLHYSRRNAELFVTLADRAALWADAKKLLHFALSNDVAEPLSAAGVQPRVAARPDEDHLLALLAGADRG